MDVNEDICLHQALILNPPQISPNATLEEALGIIYGKPPSLDPEDHPSLPQGTPERSSRTGCVLVVEDGDLVGILTERDVVRFAVQDTDLPHTPVSMVMTKPVFSLPEEELTDLFVAYNLMRRYRIRHLPIVDRQGQVVGLITISSLRQVLNQSYFLRFRQVGEVMTSHVVTVLPQDSVMTAAKRLASYGISCVVVIRATDQIVQPLGIITERDIVQFKALNLNLENIRVEEVMSSPLSCVSPQDSLVSAQQLMQRLKVRRLVVRDSYGALVGVITETNLAQVLDPLELYGVLEILELRVKQLTASRDRLLQTRNFQLEDALNNREFRLVYQPQLDLQTEQIVGAEALIRWRSPQLGNVSPVDFIPIAEYTGFIIPLGRWVLETACWQARQWQAYLKTPLTVSVNISSSQLTDPQFVVETIAILERTGLSPKNLKLELTESILVENLNLALDQFKQLQYLGIQIAIDDFGTGYASLAYLQHFSFDSLKIDRSFVSKIDENRKNAMIISAVIRLATQLNFQVIAEGVETPQERDFLEKNGCYLLQGYGISPPLEVEDWLPFLREFYPAMIRNS